MRTDLLERWTAWRRALLFLTGLLLFSAGLFPSTAHAIMQYQFDDAFRCFLQEGEMLHIYLDNSCFVLGQDQLLEPCPYECYVRRPESPMSAIIWTMVTPDKHTYGLTALGNFFLWTPGEENTWKYIRTIQEVSEMVDEASASCLAYYTDGEYLYEQVHHRGVFSMDLNCYDIATGEKKHLFTSPSYGGGPAAIHPDGGVVFEEHSGDRTRMIRITKDGKREAVVETAFFPPQLYGIVSDDADGWYLVTENEVYHLSADGKIEEVNRYTQKWFNWCVPMVYLKEQGCVLFGDENYYTVNLSPLYMEEREILTLNGKSSYLNMAMDVGAYEKRHLNVSVVRKETLSDIDDLAQAINTGDEETDLYMVSTYDDGVQRLKAKGVFYDLSGDEKLAAYVQSLYPAWREAVMTEDGRIAGIPVLVSGYNRLCCRASVWEEAGLGEVPATYDELLDCIEAWYEDGRLQDVRLFENGNSYGQLVLQLLKSNVARYAMRGETAQYEDETLVRLLKRLEGMRELLATYDQWNVYGEALLVTNMGYGLGNDGYYDDYIDLPLGMADAEDYGYLMDLYVLVINPRSSQKERAMEFLRETLAEQNAAVARMLVEPGEELGIRDEDAIASKAEAERLLAQYQEIYDIAEPDSREVWEYYITAQEEILAGYADEKTLWLVLPEADAFFRKAMEHVAINEASGYRLMWENAESVINGFIDGKTSVEAMVKKMDEVMWMWLTENE